MGRGAREERAGEVREREVHEGEEDEESEVRAEEAVLRVGDVLWGTTTGKCKCERGGECATGCRPGGTREGERRRRASQRASHRSGAGHTWRTGGSWLCWSSWPGQVGARRQGEGGRRDATAGCAAGDADHGGDDEGKDGIVQAELCGPPARFRGRLDERGGSWGGDVDGEERSGEASAGAGVVVVVCGERVRGGGRGAVVDSSECEIDGEHASALTGDSSGRS